MQAAHQPAAGPRDVSDQQLDERLNAELTVLELSPPSAGFADGGSLTLGGGHGGGYTFDSDQLDHIIARWHSVAAHADRMDEMIDVITKVSSAAVDRASTSFTSRTQAMGAGAQASHASLKSYATAYIERLQAARTNYTHTEQAVTASVNAVADGLGQ